MESIDYVPDWAKRATIYHIYPLGFFGAPKYNDGNKKTINRLKDIRSYYTHLQNLGVDVIQFGPLFESLSHGYNTIDYMRIDRRLGTNNLFKELVEEFHDLNMRVIVDGVFNHVSRDFFSFKDIRVNREKSDYLNWHIINFTGNNPYNDGFDYQTWEGHYGLVKLNLQERAVRDYLFSIVRYWMSDIGIDGWRLDVAYLVSNDFWREFRKICKGINPDCFLVGELIHGPYTKWVDRDLLDAGTEYQVHKSIWSSINSQNMYELKAVLENSYHPKWGHLKDRVMINFLGNHDTTRIRSILTDDRHLTAAFLILFTLKGIPKIYYGDEIGLRGVKTQHSDTDVRKPMIHPSGCWPSYGKEIFNIITKLNELRKKNHALIYGNLNAIYADNKTGNIIAYLRQSSKQTLLVIINTNFEVIETIIPLWNVNLENERFRDILNFNNQQEYVVKNNRIIINNLEPCWGKVLEKM